MNQSLKDKAKASFETRKMQWLKHRKDIQNYMNICPGNEEPEDEDKEMDRICDTEDAVNNFSSDDEEVGKIPIGETASNSLGEKGIT